MPIYHVWSSTKRRKWLLQGEVAEAAKKLLRAVADEKGVQLIESETMVDHVHLLVEAEDQVHLSRVMNLLKGTSSRRLFQRFPQLKPDLGVSSFWQHRYAAKEVPPTAEPAVSRYIHTQWDRLKSYER